MRVTVKWSKSDINYVKALAAKHSNTEYQKEIRTRNLSIPWRRPHDDEIWDLHVQCILTSQQASGPGSILARTFDGVPYGKSELSLNALLESKNRIERIRAFLRRNGFRMWERRSRWIRDNFERFAADGRCRILDECALPLIERRRSKKDLNRNDLIELERNAVMELAHGANKVNGMGPKQARHFLKQVGLSIYTIPVDVRLMHFLWDLLDTPDEAGPWTTALGDEYTVRMIENWFGALSEDLGMTPVELDTLIWEVYGKGSADAHRGRGDNLVEKAHD